jgi:hypothetical protein
MQKRILWLSLVLLTVLTGPVLAEVDLVTIPRRETKDLACVGSTETKYVAIGDRVDQNHVKYFVDLNPGQKRLVRYSVTYKRRKMGPELNPEKKREPL